jgi:hypothetical protein
MKVSSSFPQFHRKDLDFGTDLDRDGINEKADAQGDATVLGQESVMVLAGTFKDAVKVEACRAARACADGRPGRGDGYHGRTGII